MKYIKKFETINIIAGEDELKKKSKFGYVTVEIDGNRFYLTPEEVKMRLYVDELVNKGYDKKDIDELIELVKEVCWREERDQDIE